VYCVCLSCVWQRRDYSALVKFLLPKHEYVVSVRLSSLQISLYQQYLDKFTSASSLTSDGPGSKFQCPGLFSDYHSLMHIWTHPYVLRLDEIRQEKKVWNFHGMHFSSSVCYVYLWYNQIECITHAGHSIAFLYFVTSVLTFDLWPNIDWWARYGDGLSLCQV